MVFLSDSLSYSVDELQLIEVAGTHVATATDSYCLGTIVLSLVE